MGATTKGATASAAAVTAAAAGGALGSEARSSPGGQGDRKKPSGQYADEMTGTGAWPESDESEFDRRKDLLTGIKSKVTEARIGWDNLRALVFNGDHVWAGEGANTAAVDAERRSQAMAECEKQINHAIACCEYASKGIGTAKDLIIDNVNSELRKINEILDASAKENSDPFTAVRSIVDRAVGTNKKIVQLASNSLSGDGLSLSPALVEDENGDKADTSKGDVKPLFFSNERGGSGTDIAVRPSPDVVLDGAVPGLPVNAGASHSPDESGSTPPGRGGSHVDFAVNPGANLAPGGDAPPVPARGVSGTDVPVPPPSPRPQAPVPGGKVPPVTPGPGPAAPEGPSVGAPSIGGSLGGGGGGSTSGVPSAPSSPLSGGLSSSSGFEQVADASRSGLTVPTGPPPPANPLQQFAQSFANSASAGPAMQSSSAGMAPPPIQSLDAPATTNTPASAPMHSSGGPAPVAAAPSASVPASGGGPTGLGMGPGGGGMPPPMSLGPPPTPPPAAPAAAAAPPVAPPPGAGAAASQPAVAAAVPVTAARAERDAAAASLRRESGTDPVQVARRIAAALNAPPSVPEFEIGFVWATGLAVDGTIIVANSYGLGYIPEGVNLPQNVRMASADESIPPANRAKWAAYPYLALQGWAQAHDTRLRLVFGTEEQLQGIDPGAPKVMLTEQDIPADGTMQGRSRLEVIAPEAAARLAAVGDADLTTLLPLRPADDTPPQDDTDALWFEMLKPLMQAGTGTEVAHLEAFIPYANNEYELALHRAHTATEAVAQRAAIADWVYWQHVSVLISDALAPPK